MKKITMLALFFSTVWGYSQATNCPVSTEFFEDFDTYTIVTTLQVHVPDCWSGAITPGAPAYSAMRNVSGSNRLFLNSNTNSSPIPSMAYATMPTVSNLQAGNHRLRFKAYGTDANGSGGKWLDVGYYDGTGNFVLGQTIQNLPSTAASIQEYIINPATWTPAIPSGVTNLVFRNSNNTLASIYIDDVSWEPIPQACAANVKLPIAAKLITDTSAVLSWTAGGSETAWQYVCVPAGAINPYALTGTDVPGTSPTVPLSGLLPATNYKVWVRSKCTDGSLGAWIGAFAFSTTCTPGTDILENFDGGVIPACWRLVGSVGSMGIGGSPIPAPPSGSNYLSITGGYMATPYIPFTIVTLPPLSNAGAGDHRLKFKASINVANPNASTQLVVGWLSDVTNSDSFHELVTINDLTTTGFNSYVYSFGALPQSPYLAFKNPGTVGSNIIKIDDVVWETTPICRDLSDIAVEMVNSTSAELSWTVGGKESTWQYVITSGTETDPSKLTPANVPSPVLSDIYVDATFTGLMPNTAYKMWLRPKCDTNLLGNWNEPILITTPCSPVTDFTQNFDDSQSMPSCWSKAGNTGYASIGSINTSTPPSTPYILSMQSVSTTAVAVVAMPGVSNINAGTRRLKFQYQSDTVGAKLDVGYLKNVNDQASFVTLLTAPFTCTAAFQNASLDFGMDAVPDGIEVLAFKNTGEVSASIHVDNVSWLPLNGVAAPVNDEAAGATLLTVGQNFGSNSVIETTAGATTSAQTAPGCGNYKGSDVWSKAVVPASGKITFEINTMAGGIKNTAGAVYSGTASSLTLISCDDSSSTAGDDHPKISLSGRTPGEVLYFRVWDYGATASGSFYASAYDTTVLGTDTFETNNFAFYPNPVRDVLNLSLNQEIANVTVLNLLGQQVINQPANGNEVKLDMSTLSKGAYLVKVVSGNESKTIKVLKE